MIGRLEGQLLEKGPERVILDVGGVGYELQLPLSTFLELPDAGKTIRFCVHTYVREDQLRLYGFLREEERSAFGILLGINGVGPRLALAILSGLSVPRLVQAVQRDDRAALRGIPGVGAKTAERILVELRDKVNRIETVSSPEPVTEQDEATVSALLNLGYPLAQAQRAVRQALERLGDEPSLEELIREALRVAAG